MQIVHNKQGFVDSDGTTAETQLAGLLEENSTCPFDKLRYKFELATGRIFMDFNVWYTKMQLI